MDNKVDIVEILDKGYIADIVGKVNLADIVNIHSNIGDVFESWYCDIHFNISILKYGDFEIFEWLNIGIL